MSKVSKIKAFNPNSPAFSEQLYGLPFTADESKVIVLGVPWEMTVSSATGTARGPQAILEASWQVDLYQEDIPDAWMHGIHFEILKGDWLKKNNDLRKIAEKYLDTLVDQQGAPLSLHWQQQLKKLNEASRLLNNALFEQSLSWLQQEKIVSVVGGEHSTPLGLLWALATKHEAFGILQIDAHADLRIAYEGFEYSHASIMHNALQLSQVEQLTIVGLRDFCQAEADYIENDSRITAYTDKTLQKALFNGENWSSIVHDIIASLPQKVYISFDIDGLSPEFCPQTGTPVPGGLSFSQAEFLIQQVVESEKEIIGFDLCEVAGNAWDANVGARMLYKLCNYTALSQGKVIKK